MMTMVATSDIVLLKWMLMGPRRLCICMKYASLKRKLGERSYKYAHLYNNLNEKGFLLQPQHLRASVILQGK